MAPTQAFNVQRGTLTISASSATATITAGVDYTAPAALSSAFIYINSTRHTGMGSTGGGSQNQDDTTVRITNPGNLLTSITFERAGTANACRVTWEIVEYVGAGGGANEFIVRDQATITASTGTTLTGSTVTTISDIDKACLWLTSQSTADTGRADWHEALWTGDLVANASDWDPTFTKLAAALNNSAWVSYAVIEFTGSNWRDVQRIETTTTGTAWTSAEDAGAGWTFAIPTTLLDASKAFIHCQYATSNDATGLDDAGDTVTIDSTTNLRLWNRVTTGTRNKVIWLMENTQSDGTARNLTVQHDTHFEDNGGTEERVSTRTITTVDALDETSLQGTVSCDGGGTAYPRGCVDLRLTDTSTVTKTTSDNGQEYQFALEIIQWPEDPDTGTTHSADASVTGSATATGTVNLTAEGQGDVSGSATAAGTVSLTAAAQSAVTGDATTAGIAGRRIGATANITASGTVTGTIMIYLRAMVNALASAGVTSTAALRAAVVATVVAMGSAASTVGLTARGVAAQLGAAVGLASAGVTRSASASVTGVATASATASDGPVVPTEDTKIKTGIYSGMRTGMTTNAWIS